MSSPLSRETLEVPSSTSQSAISPSNSILVKPTILSPIFLSNEQDPQGPKSYTRLTKGPPVTQSISEVRTTSILPQGEAWGSRRSSFNQPQIRSYSAAPQGNTRLRPLPMQEQREPESKGGFFQRFFKFCDTTFCDDTVCEPKVEDQQKFFSVKQVENHFQGGPVQYQPRIASTPVHLSGEPFHSTPTYESPTLDDIVVNYEHREFKHDPRMGRYVQQQPSMSQKQYMQSSQFEKSYAPTTVAYPYTYANNSKGNEVAALQSQINSLKAGMAGGEKSGDLMRAHSELLRKEDDLEALKVELDELKKEKANMDSRLLEKDVALAKMRKGDFFDSKVGGDMKDTYKLVQNVEEENRLLRRRLDAMRSERNDLQEIVVQKERQMSLLHGVDPTMKEASAMQLGLQAISMVENSVALKDKLLAAEAEVAAFKEEKKSMTSQLENLFEKLTEKRKEAASLVELISQRDMKIAKVESLLQLHRKEHSAYVEKMSNLLKEEKNLVRKGKEEIAVVQEQNNVLKHAVSSRDEKILCLQNEVVRRDASIRQLNDRIKGLSEELDATGANLQQAIRASAAKEAYVHQLETQMRRNEVERQASYLAEISKTRSLILDTKLREDECKIALNEREENLASAKHQLTRNQHTLEKVRQALVSIDISDTCYRPSANIRSASPHQHDGRAEQFSSIIANDTLRQVPLKESLASMNAEYLQSSNSLASNNSTPQFVHSLPNQGEFAYSDYIPMKGDQIDEALGELLCNDESYRTLKPMFCRLSAGNYIFGSNQYKLGVDTNNGLLVQRPNNPREWQTMTSFLDQALEEMRKNAAKPSK